MVTYHLRSKAIAENAARYIMSLPINADSPMTVKIAETKRTLDQNALLWPLLECMAKQADWHGNKLSKEEWKDLLSAGLIKTKVVPNLDGSGFVMLGQRTSKMSKKLFSELIELVYSVGAENGVDFSGAKREYEETGVEP